MSDEPKSPITGGQWVAAVLMMLGLLAAIVWRYFWPYPPIYIAVVFVVLLAAGLIAAKLSRGRNGARGVTTSRDRPPGDTGQP
jgi:general stress protein CsbA